VTSKETWSLVCVGGSPCYTNVTSTSSYTAH